MRKLTILLTLILLASQPATSQEAPVLVGPARLDLNTRSGDQNQRSTFSTPEAGSSIIVDVAVSESGDKRFGFDLHLTYDPAVIAFQAAEPVDLFEGAHLLPALEPGEFTLSGLRLDTPTARSTGSVVQVTFAVLGDVSEGSTISLDRLHLGTAFRIDSLQVGTQSSVVTLGGATTPVALDKPDFDGDGSVGFTDFIIFAGGFGAVAGDQSYNPILDLDESGDVGFSDFLTFAQAFGT